MVNVFSIEKVLRSKDRLLLAGSDNQGNNFLHRIIIKFPHIGMQTYIARARSLLGSVRAVTIIPKQKSSASVFAKHGIRQVLHCTSLIISTPRSRKWWLLSYDVRLLQSYPHHEIRRYPFIHLGGERH